MTTFRLNVGLELFKDFGRANEIGTGEDVAVPDSVDDVEIYF